MKNIFIYTNSIVARTLSFQIGYVFNFPIRKIILLQENHSEDELFGTGDEIEVCICNSFEECVEQCDIIITSNELNTTLLQDAGKEIIVIDTDKKSSEYKEDVPNLNYNEKPVVAILCMGDFTDQYCIETLANKILSEKNAKLSQHFSHDTKKMLDSLVQHSYLNPNMYNSDESDAIIVSLNEIKEYSRLVQVLKHISPDVLIVCVDNISYNETKLSDFLKFVCSIDLVVKSPYVQYEVVEGQIFPVYCGDVDSTDAMSSLDKNLEQALEKAIMRNIFTPMSVKTV